MQLITAVTHEIDNYEQAALDLIHGIDSQEKLCTNKIGILYYDIETEADLLSDYLSKHYQMDIIGCSTTASISKKGYHSMSIMFSVLTADDCDFSVGISKEVAAGNAKTELLDTYKKCEAKLKNKTKLIFLFSTFLPINLDKHMDDLTEASNNSIIIGGFPGSSYSFSKTTVYNGSYVSDKIVLICIAGNIMPTASVANVISPFSNQKCTVTKVDHAVIKEVDGNKTFLEYIKNHGLDLDTLASDTENRAFFQKYPLLVSNPNIENDEPYVRVMKNFNFESGECTLFAGIALNSVISLYTLRREDIEESVTKGLKTLFERMAENEKKGYKYSAIFCISCSARHFIMTPSYEMESNTILSAVPQDVNIMGFYSFGEIGPTSIAEGKVINRIHNASITFCAF